MLVTQDRCGPPQWAARYRDLVCTGGGGPVLDMETPMGTSSSFTAPLISPHFSSPLRCVGVLGFEAAVHGVLA
jgi:hypothetical protein